MADRKRGFKYDHLREEARRPVGGRAMGGGSAPPAGGTVPGRKRVATRRKRPRNWAHQLRELGVIVSEDGDAAALVNQAGHGLEITGERTRRGEVWRWAVTVRAPGMDPRLRLVPEDGVSRIKKLVVGEDLLTGDADFDAAVHVSGYDLDVITRLSHATRASVLKVLAHGRIADRTIEWSHESAHPRPADLPGRIRQLSTLARKLSAPVGHMKRLERRLLHDPDPGHRARVLTLLLAHNKEIAPDVQAKLLRDRAAEVRLRAAIMFDDHAVLSSIAADSAVDLPLRTEAVEMLGWVADPTTAMGIDAAVGAVEHAVVARALLVVVDRHPAFVASLGEAAALIILDLGPRDTHAAAIDRLGEIGTERAIPALVKIADAFFGRRALKDRARAAAGRITTRQGGLRQGGLSVVEHADGALSLDEPG